MKKNIWYQFSDKNDYDEFKNTTKKINLSISDLKIHVEYMRKRMNNEQFKQVPKPTTLEKKDWTAYCFKLEKIWKATQ